MAELRALPASAQSDHASAPVVASIRSSELDSGDPAGTAMGIEILSDTQGVDFNPYMRGVWKTINANWAKLLQEDAGASEVPAGSTAVRFTIGKDGSITAMHLEQNTHNERINRAGWGAITTAHEFTPLPETFHGPSLELRVHFRTNAGGTGTPRASVPAA